MDDGFRWKPNCIWELLRMFCHKQQNIRTFKCFRPVWETIEELNSKRMPAQDACWLIKVGSMRYGATSFSAPPQPNPSFIVRIWKQPTLKHYYRQSNPYLKTRSQASRIEQVPLIIPMSALSKIANTLKLGFVSGSNAVQPKVQPENIQTPLRCQSRNPNKKI